MASWHGGKLSKKERKGLANAIGAYRAAPSSALLMHYEAYQKTSYFMIRDGSNGPVWLTLNNQTFALFGHKDGVLFLVPNCYATEASLGNNLNQHFKSANLLNQSVRDRLALLVYSPDKTSSAPASPSFSCAPLPLSSTTASGLKFCAANGPRCRQMPLSSAFCSTCGAAQPVYMQ